MKARLLTLVLLLAAPACAGAADALLSKAYPDVRWEKAATIRVDLIGKGSAGLFAMGTDPAGHVVVAFRSGNSDRTWKLVFPRSSLDCSPVLFDQKCPRIDRTFDRKLSKARIDKEKVHWMEVRFGPSIKGIFVDNGKAEFVVVPVDDVDPFYFLWNRKTQRLAWLKE